ncbi:MAG: Polyphosphate:AMP phosphotransferase [Ilumatobacteraceae bacterium]|nr:Polyphosphate:AMP phosphotransferase [Ilumatobacteraceae bacterium]
MLLERLSALPVRHRVTATVTGMSDEQQAARAAAKQVEAKVAKFLARLRVKPESDFVFKQRTPDQDFGWERADAERELAVLLLDIDRLQQRLAAESQRGLLVVLQAIDAAGKDGTVRSVFGPLNAADVRVSSFKAPTSAELGHDYLWRVHALAPARGEIAVWNRSHYEDVLIARVKNLVPEERWHHRYRHIREFERMLVDEGTTIVKINLHISKEEQRERLQARIDDPEKRWKFRLGDLDDRQLWSQYMRAYEAAFNETSTARAPWYVVPANHKWVRDLCVARIVHHALTQIDPQLPPGDPAILSVVVQ